MPVKVISDISHCVKNLLFGVQETQRVIQRQLLLRRKQKNKQKTR